MGLNHRQKDIGWISGGGVEPFWLSRGGHTIQQFCPPHLQKGDEKGKEVLFHKKGGGLLLLQAVWPKGAQSSSQRDVQAALNPAPAARPSRLQVLCQAADFLLLVPVAVLLPGLAFAGLGLGDRMPRGARGPLVPPRQGTDILLPGRGRVRTFSPRPFCQAAKEAAAGLLGAPRLKSACEEVRQRGEDQPNIAQPASVVAEWDSHRGPHPTPRPALKTPCPR